MSNRPKPSERPELRAVDTTEAGELLEAPAAPDKLTEWESKIYSGAEILGIAPRRWALKEWLPLDAVVVPYGPPGTGKSLYALTLGLELARGGRWAGSPLAPMRVLYVAAERPTDQRDRAEAWMKHHEEQLPRGFHLLAPERPPQLTSELDVSLLERLIEKHEYRVVILDTYAKMTLGVEENSSATTGAVLGMIDRLRVATRGGTILVVHHTGKDSSKGLRGSSAFLGSVDLTIELSVRTDGIVKAGVEKANAGRKPTAEWYKITPVLLPALPGETEMRSVPVMLSTGRPLEGPTESILELVGSFVTASRRQISEGLRTDYEQDLSDANLSRQLSDLVKAGELVMNGKPGSRYVTYSLPVSVPSTLEELI
jgi:hypothetical protein